MKNEKKPGLFGEVKKIFYFVHRDMKIMLTYRLAFVTMFTGIFFSLVNLVLFGAMFGVTELSSLEFYGGNYISYVIVGSIGWGFMWSISGATSNALRGEMTMGTLEAIMSTPTKITTLVLSYTIFGAIFGFLSILLLVGVGASIFGFGIFGTVSLATVVIFFLLIVMMGGIGMMFGGLTVWTKNVGQLVGFFQNVAMFFAGVYFPLSVLPSVVRPVAYGMPFYYSMEGLRRSLIPGAPDVWYYTGITAAMSVAFLAMGYFILAYGIKKAKKDGSLSFY